MVGVQELYSSGTAIRETAVGGVPFALFLAYSQKLSSQRSVEDIIGDKGFVVPEVGELVIFCL